MRPRTLPALLLLGGALLLFAGCDAIFGPSPGLELEVVIDPVVLVPGDTAAISVTVRNASDRKIILYSGWGDPPIMTYEVRDLAGQVVSPVVSPGNDIVSGFSLSFLPGESRSYTFRWTGETHVPYWQPDEPAPLGEGEYRVVGIAQRQAKQWTGQTAVWIESRE